MKKIVCVFLAAVMLLAICLLGCSKEREIIWVNYGESKNIPCLQIPDAEVATRADYRYILRKANKVGVPEDWGYLEKKVREENQPMENLLMGGGVYLTRYVNVTLQTYRDFLEDLKTQEFTVLAESCLQDAVYTTALNYKGNSYTVTYFAKTATIDVTASKEDHLSPYLQKENDSTKDKAVEGYSTTLTMRPLRNNSTGYVIQLPNGHYVISGGGTMWDLSSLVEYLKEHAPEGEVPVVEAWFLCTASYDVANWVTGLNRLEEGQICVNGVYFNQPSNKVIDNTLFEENVQDGETYYTRGTNNTHSLIMSNVGLLKTEKGEETPIYRPMSGQIYYFNGGLTVEIPLTQEQMELDEYEFDFKVASGSLVIRAGEKMFFDMAYLCKPNQQKLVDTYGAEYFGDMDLVLTPYRGRRMYPEFQDVFSTKYILFCSSKVQQLEEEYAQVYRYYAEKEDVQLVSYSDGTFIYDFATGESEIRPAQQRPWG